MSSDGTAMNREWNEIVGDLEAEAIKLARSGKYEAAGLLNEAAVAIEELVADFETLAKAGEGR